jgi:WD40 repeat protein
VTDYTFPPFGLAVTMSTPALALRNRPPARIAILVLLVAALAVVAQTEPAIPGLICTLSGHGDAVYSVGFVGDGRTVVTGSFDKSVRLWDAATGKELRVFGGAQGHQNYVLSVSVSADGRRLASGGSDATVKLWDLPADAAPRVFAHPDVVRGLAVSPDGQKLATAGRDGRVRLWDAGGGARLAEFSGFEGPATGVAFTGQGKFLIGVGADHSVRSWLAADGSPVTASLGHSGPVTSVVAQPSGGIGAVIFTAGEDGVLKYWQLPTAPRQSPPVAAALRALVITVDGRTVCAAAADGTVPVLTVADGKVVRTLTGPTAAVNTLAMSAGATTLAGGTGDGQLWVWDPTVGKALWHVAAHEGSTNAVALHPGTPNILSAGADGLIKLWVPPPPGRTAEATARIAIPAHPGGVAAATFGASANQAISAGADGSVKLWDLGAKKELRTYGTFSAAATALAVGRYAAQVAAAAGPEVRLWRGGDGKLVQTFQHPSSVTSLAFDAAGTTLLAGTERGTTHVWDLKSGLELQAFVGDAAVRSVLPMPTSALILSAGDDKRITVLRPSAVRAVRASPKPLRALALTPDGRIVLAAGDDGIVRGFSASNAAPGPTFPGADRPIHAIAVSADGKLLAACGDQQVHLWTIADGKPALGIPASAVIRALAFHPTADLLAAGGDDRAATLWKVGASPAQATQTFPLGGPVTALAYGREGGALFAASLDRTVHAWRPSSEIPTTLPHPNLVDAVAFQPGGGRLATGGHDGVLRLWDAGGRPERTIAAHAPPAVIHAIAWDLSGKRIVTGSSDQTAKLWDAETGKLIRTFGGFDEKTNPHGHRGAIYTVAVSSDGVLVATGGADRLAKLWRVTDGQFVRDFSWRPAQSAHQGAVYSIRFTPDGKKLLTGGSAANNRGALAVWQVSDGKPEFAETLSTGPIFALAISADGRRTALACGPRGRGGPSLAYVLATLGQH